MATQCSQKHKQFSSLFVTLSQLVMRFTWHSTSRPSDGENKPYQRLKDERNPSKTVICKT